MNNQHLEKLDNIEKKMKQFIDKCEEILGKKLDEKLNPFIQKQDVMIKKMDNIIEKQEDMIKNQDKMIDNQNIMINNLDKIIKIF